MKRQKKVKVESKSSKKKKITTIIIISLILIFIGILVLNIVGNNSENNETIIATKTITEENQIKQDVQYTIKVKDYNIELITKKIVFETEQEAKTEYKRYETTNKFEGTEIGLELKKKELILTIPEKQLKQELEYTNNNNITILTQTGEKREITNIQLIKEKLQQQGYTIK